jgi:predicted dehydrogenase
MKLKSAIIGCGRIGCSFDDDPKRKIISTHAGAYEANSQVDLVALCDLDESKLEKYGLKYNITNLYTDPKLMLEELDLDIVSICTNPNTHHELVKLISNSGVKTIFCEKPMADNVSHAKEIIQTCKNNNTILVVDHQRRFQPLYKQIKKIIENGELGKIQQSTFYYTAGIDNTGSHMIDTLRFFFGDVEWISGINSETKSNKENDPNIDGMLKFKNGTLCMIQSLDNSNYLIFEHDILGTKARLKITKSGFKHEIYQVDESDIFSGYNELFIQDEPLLNEPLGQPMVEGIQHLINCSNKEDDPICSMYDGLAVVEILNGLKFSASNNGQRVYLPFNE